MSGAIAQSEEIYSIAKYGRASQALGFPKTDLAFQTQADAQPITDRTVARFSNITRHIESVTADTNIDQEWLGPLADLDTGQKVSVVREGIRPLTLDNVLVGIDYRLTPGRLEAVLHLSTITPTF